MHLILFSNINIETDTSAYEGQYETRMRAKDVNLALLDADINIANCPNSNEKRNQTAENGQWLPQGIHEGVIVGHL